MRHGQHKGAYRAAVAALRADIGCWQRQIADNEKLIAQLTERADINGGGTRGTGTVLALRVPLKKRRRRRLKARSPKAHSRPRKATERRRAVPLPDTAPAAAVTEAAPTKAVRGAAQFGAELKAIDGIVIALRAADMALTKASRAKDGAGIAAASGEIQRLRAQGGELLVRLSGKAKLPAALDVVEGRRWRAAVTAAAPKPKKPRRPTPSPPPVRKIDSGWTEENGVRSRTITSIEDRP